MARTAKTKTARRKTAHRKSAAKRPARKWSARVTERSDAMTLEDSESSAARPPSRNH
jgi:hypothetical protein